MNYQDRTNAIGTLLREHILPRYKRPEHLDDGTARAELRDMVEDLNHEWPVMNESRFGEIAERLARAVRVTNTSRTWPTIAVMVKALKAALDAPAPEVESEEEKPIVWECVREWWVKFRQAGPASMAKSHHAERLVQEGLATPGELRRGGFHLSGALHEQAMAEPNPDHPRMLQDLIDLNHRLNGAPRGNVSDHGRSIINSAPEPF